jgi:hypothetical protein
MKAEEIFQKLIENLPQNDKKYIICKLKDYSEFCSELFRKNIKNYPFLVNLIQKECFEKISSKLTTEEQISFLKNILKGRSRSYLKAYRQQIVTNKKNEQKILRRNRE